jgi:hypothetical protein
VSSGEWKKEGGILGKLNFELDLDLDGALSPELPLDPDTAASRNSSLVIAEDGTKAEQPRPSQDRISVAGSSESAVLVDRPNVSGQDAGEARGEEMEQLETPEKRRFWKGKGRARRLSKAMSDLDAEARVSRLTHSPA